MVPFIIIDVPALLSRWIPPVAYPMSDTPYSEPGYPEQGSIEKDIQ
jgi:hypothetical protein